MKNFMKAKISRAMESWPRKNAVRAFILKAGGMQWWVVDEM
jgi:hypothetical protein